MKTLVLATRNRHKVEEIRTMLGAGVRVLDLTSFTKAPGVVEDAPTFAGNAAKKALTLAAWLAQTNPPELPAGDAWVLADDSGLEVDFLGGAPGVHSARFAALDAGPEAPAGNSPDAANNAKLLRLLQNVPLPQRTARFRCVLALAPVTTQPGEPSTFDGACEGKISHAPSGQAGFGYDPLFVPEGYQQSFAELGESIKNQFSHRSRALAKLKQWMK